MYRGENIRFLYTQIKVFVEPISNIDLVTYVFPTQKANSLNKNVWLSVSFLILIFSFPQFSRHPGAACYPDRGHSWMLWRERSTQSREWWDSQRQDWCCRMLCQVPLCCPTTLHIHREPAHKCKMVVLTEFSIPKRFYGWSFCECLVLPKVQNARVNYQNLFERSLFFS